VVLQRIFKFRTCTLDIDADDEQWRWFRPCLLASIGQCTAPCNLRITKDDYRRDIQRLKTFLDGGKRQLLDDMRREMLEASGRLEFEKAARLRDEIQLLETLGDRGDLEEHVQPEVFLVDPKKGLAGLAKAGDRGRGHRAPGRRRDRGQPRAVHRRAAVQARL
jgi:excinuclease ABC subunit C